MAACCRPMAQDAPPPELLSPDLPEQAAEYSSGRNIYRVQYAENRLFSQSQTSFDLLLYFVIIAARGISGYQLADKTGEKQLCAKNHRCQRYIEVR